MRYYASHQDAFAFWYEKAQEGFACSRAANVTSLEHAVSSDADAQRVEFLRLASIQAPPFPNPGGLRCADAYGMGSRHVLVTHNKTRRQGSSICRHLWSAPIPPGAFRAIAPGVLVSSPEFTYLQLAREFDLVDAALVGTCLCSRYRLVTKAGNDQAFIHECKPVTTVADIASFLASVHHVPGLSQAKAALKLVCEGSRSPMETEMHALASWPSRMGGYGFAGLALNWKLNLANGVVDITDRANRSHAEIDLYDQAHHVGLEYDGSDHELTRYEDALRRNMLLAMGERILHVESRIIRNPAEFDTLMRQFACLRGEAQPSHDASWAIAHDLLRRRLEGPDRLRL